MGSRATVQILTTGYSDAMKMVTLRLPDTLHAELKELSEQENRSLHGEIVYCLKRAVASEKQTSLNNKELNDAQGQRSQTNR